MSAVLMARECVLPSSAFSDAGHSAAGVVAPVFSGLPLRLNTINLRLRRRRDDFGPLAAFGFVNLRPNRARYLEAGPRKNVRRARPPVRMIRKRHNRAVPWNPRQPRLQIVDLNVEIDGESAYLADFVRPPHVHDQNAARLGQQFVE